VWYVVARRYAAHAQETLDPDTAGAAITAGRARPLESILDTEFRTWV
jgi:hypothetical protein